MSPNDPNYQDAKSSANSTNANSSGEGDTHPTRRGAGRRLRIIGLVFALLVVVTAAALFVWHRHLGTEMRENLPQLDGSLTVYGLSAPVTVDRDARGVPHIHASSMNDLVFAQGYITAQDRLWQMDLLRRHAAGQLAAILRRRPAEPLAVADPESAFTGSAEDIVACGSWVFGSLELMV